MEADKEKNSNNNAKCKIQNTTTKQNKLKCQTKQLKKTKTIGTDQTIA